MRTWILIIYKSSIWPFQAKEIHLSRRSKKNNLDYEVISVSAILQDWLALWEERIMLHVWILKSLASLCICSLLGTFALDSGGTAKSRDCVVDKWRHQQTACKHASCQIYTSIVGITGQIPLVRYSPFYRDDRFMSTGIKMRKHYWNRTKRKGLFL